MELYDWSWSVDTILLLSPSGSEVNCFRHIGESDRGRPRA